MTRPIGSRKLDHIAIIVRDIEESSSVFAKMFGMEVPDWILTDPFEKTNCHYRGEPSDALCKLTFFDFENIRIEMIEPVGEPSTWMQFLQRNGEGIQHLSFWVDDLEAQTEALKRQGTERVQTGEFENGRNAYFDTADKIGIMLELLEDLS